MLGERRKPGIELTAHGDFYAEKLYEYANRKSRLTPISGSLTQLAGKTYVLISAYGIIVKGW
jgi:hypothetical protein